MPSFTGFNLLDMTISDLLGLTGQVVGWIIVYGIALNFMLRGIKLILSTGIIHGFIQRICYFTYGIIVMPILLLVLVVMAPLYPLCMVYNHIIEPCMACMCIYMDIAIELTGVIPDFVNVCVSFMLNKINRVEMPIYDLNCEQEFHNIRQ
jgi:hypothetical protein